jgi:hypothetical protein
MRVTTAASDHFYRTLILIQPWTILARHHKTTILVTALPVETIVVDMEAVGRIVSSGIAVMEVSAMSHLPTMTALPNDDA